MNILAYNPGHDGAIVHLRDTQLLASIEAEKNSNYRYAPVSGRDVFVMLSEIGEIPDVICISGWWRRDHYEYLHGSTINVGYRGLSKSESILERRRFLGKTVQYFSSSHERSHILCAFGLSPLPRGTPCYALVWEGEMGTFYEIDPELNITLIGDVLTQPGNRYGLVYGLADPTFPKNGPYPRATDAGKLMALASFSSRNIPTPEEKQLLAFLLDGPYRDWSAYEGLEHSSYRDVGIDDQEFRNFAGIFSDKLFEKFYEFAKSHLNKQLPLIVAGGCGLNCDWNSKWSQSGLFTEVFVPPVANDSGSAIGTAIDAQFHLTGNPKIDWTVYCGLEFIVSDSFDSGPYDIYETDCGQLADMLANGLIVGWVTGKYEIGPRALGNRSILAEPFHPRTRMRLNEIKQREQFRPIAPVCLEEEAAQWFDCARPSPHMLYTHRAKTSALAAVTHANGTARLQTVSAESNRRLYDLLVAFKARSGYGVLCNTSLNFAGKGFINNLTDLSEFARAHGLDGFIVNDRTYLLRSSKNYQAFLRGPRATSG